MLIKDLISTQKQPPEAAIIKGVLRNFSEFTGEQLRQSLFSLFSCELREKFLRTPLLQKTSGRLILNTTVLKFK